MRRGVASISVCLMLMAILFSPSLVEGQRDNGLSNGVCITRGFFIYQGEDDDYVYFNAIYAIVLFLMNDKGTGFAILINSEVKFSKPFHFISVSVDNYTYIFWGICENWDFVG